MLQQTIDHTFLREKALGDGLGEVASELRLIDAIDLVSYIRNEQYANVGDLVNSAIERFFKPTTLRYGRSAEVEMNWGSAPSIKIDMEFHNHDICVFFRLVLEDIVAGVHINYISFGESESDQKTNTARLLDAIDDARLAPDTRWLPSQPSCSAGPAP